MSKRATVIGLMLLAVLGLATVARGEIRRNGNVQVKVSGNMAPQRLPRKGATPISVFFSGQISTTDASQPPRLETLKIEINRYGKLDSQGLPVCKASQIQTASSSRALALCRNALVGQGRFQANAFLTGQEPYPASGRLLLFNSRKGGKPVVLGHIYSDYPFATSFVIPFAIRQIAKGRYGTELAAKLPSSMKTWGNVTGIEMKLYRLYRYRGAKRSFISASCPAPSGFGGASFDLARASFGFAGATSISTDLSRNCKVRGR